jgi:hypothetical protein
MQLSSIVRARFDLGLAVLLACLGLISSLWTGEPAALRLILGGPVVLVIPGYALSVALLPDPAVDWPTRVLLTGGLSVACLALAGIALNATPFGLNPVSWGVFIWALTLIAAAVAVARTRMLPVVATGSQTNRLRSIPMRPAAIVTLAGLTLLGAMWIAVTPVAEQPQQGYTLLWGTPSTSDQSNTIQFGVRSLESGPTNYHLRIVSGDQVIRDVTLALNPSDEWDADLTLPESSSGAYEALLYRDDAPGVVYRRVLVRVGQT